MLVSGPMAEARFLLNDAGAEPRIPKETLIQWADEGQADALKRRPDLALSPDGSALQTPTPVVNENSALLLPDGLRNALGCYLAYRALRADNSDTANLAAANNFYASYLAELTGFVGK